MLDVAADQALAFRIAAHHLDRRVDATQAVAAIGLQEYPPGWGATSALRARSLDPLPPDVVQVNSFRGVPYVVPSDDVRIFTAALVPEDEAGLKSLVGSAPAKEVAEAGFEVAEALRLVGAAARAGLARGPLDREAFHQAMRERLPDGLLPWCRGCERPPRAPGALARPRAAGGHRDAREGDVGAGAAAVDVARRRTGGAGAALPPRIRTGDALTARLVGSDRCLAREAPVRGGQGELEPAATTHTSRSPTGRRSCRTPR